MLRRKLADELLPTGAGRLAVTFTSFGHKHGPLRDADLAFDVRFLPNPHYEEEMRRRPGSTRVVAYIDRDGGLEEFYGHLVPLLDYLLPQYVHEGKSHLSWPIGCTGGRHRSVAVAEHLARAFRRVRRVHRRHRAPRHHKPRAQLSPSAPAETIHPVIDHVEVEISDLERSARFYDAVFRALGARRIFDSPDAIGYGINDARLWIVARGRAPAPGFGHVAIDRQRPAGGRRRLRRPRLAAGGHRRRRARARATSTARATTRPICSIRTGCAVEVVSGAHSDAGAESPASGAARTRSRGARAPPRACAMRWRRARPVRRSARSPRA